MVREARAELRRAGAEVDFVVVIVAPADPESDGLDPALVHAPLAARLHLVLVHVDARPVRQRVGAGNAVEVVILSVGDADEPAETDQGRPGREPVAVDERVELTSFRRIVVAGLAREAVRVDGNIVVPGSDLVGAVEAAVGRSHAASDFAGEPVSGDEARDAVVAGVDDATDCTRPVSQRRRATDYLDLVGGVRVDRHRVVFAQRRGVVGADAVLAHADAVAVEPADDRPARSGCEIRSRDPGFVLQAVREVRAAGGRQVQRGQHGERHEDLLGDDDGLRDRRR